MKRFTLVASMVACLTLVGCGGSTAKTGSWFSRTAEASPPVELTPIAPTAPARSVTLEGLGEKMTEMAKDSNSNFTALQSRLVRSESDMLHMRDRVGALSNSIAAINATDQLSTLARRQDLIMWLLAIAFCIFLLQGIRHVRRNGLLSFAAFRSVGDQLTAAREAAHGIRSRTSQPAAAASPAVVPDPVASEMVAQAG